MRLNNIFGLILKTSRGRIKSFGDLSNQR